MSYYPPAARNEFVIIAPENGTTVRIFLPPEGLPEEQIRVQYVGGTYKNGDTMIVSCANYTGSFYYVAAPQCSSSLHLYCSLQYTPRVVFLQTLIHSLHNGI